MLPLPAHAFSVRELKIPTTIVQRQRPCDVMMARLAVLAHQMQAKQQSKSQIPGMVYLSALQWLAERVYHSHSGVLTPCAA
jgi:hypothetical protein